MENKKSIFPAIAPLGVLYCLFGMLYLASGASNAFGSALQFVLGWFGIPIVVCFMASGAKDILALVNSKERQKQATINNLKTLLAYALLVGGTFASMKATGQGLQMSFINLLLSIGLPLVMLYFSGPIALKQMNAKPIRKDTTDEDEIFLVATVTELIEEGKAKGLLPKDLNPVICMSEKPEPNAFATGRDPAHSYVAATRGLMRLGYTKEQLRGVFAHELYHVKDRDMAVNVGLAIVSSIFFQAFDGVLKLVRVIISKSTDALEAAINKAAEGGKNAVAEFVMAIVKAVRDFLDKIKGGFDLYFEDSQDGEDHPLRFKVENQQEASIAPQNQSLLSKLANNAGFGVSTILTWLIMQVISRIVSTAIRLVQMMAFRSRESLADIGATELVNPCDLHTALQLLQDFYAKRNRSFSPSKALFYRAVGFMLFVDPYNAHISEAAADPKQKKGGFIAWLIRVWKELNGNHPSVPRRLAVLDKISVEVNEGKTCPIVVDGAN